MWIRPLDKEALRREFNEAQPFRFVCIDGFLEPSFAQQVARSYPSFGDANRYGRNFEAVNEHRKVQVTNPARFPEPVQQLADALQDQELLDTLTYMSGIRKLVWDDGFSGGGMHQTASSGLLDVHVDFNRLQGKGLHRRLNLLLYLNPIWDPAWGGLLELWDDRVRRRHHVFEPVLNRCVIFETSDISFHGVTPVRCPPQVARKSFAVYYYTREAPPHWTGKEHGTVFKARPDERIKRYVLMPAETVQRQVRRGLAKAKRGIAKLAG